MSDKKTNIFSKLLEVKRKVPSISKNAEGFNFKYANPSQVLGTLNPLLNEAGILLKTEVINVEKERVFTKKKSIKYYLNGSQVEEVIDVYETLFHLDFRFTWIDIDTGEKDENLFSASGMNSDDKGLGSALTYGERYFMLKYFNIPTDEDDPDHLSNAQNGVKKESDPVQAKEWLTKDQFEKAMKSDIKGIAATITKYTSATHGMKKEYREKLTAQLAELKNK